MAFFEAKTAKVDKINAPLLVVGLGGTGADGVRRVKHEFKERLNPEKLSETELDRPPRTAYLVLDTASNEKNKSYHGTKLDPDDEWVDMSCNVSYILGEEGVHLDPCVKEWLDKRFYTDRDLIANAATDGAGTYRQLSRLMLFRKAQDIIIKLTAALTRLATVAPGDPVGAHRINVVVISGLSGGTGSGCFLDFAYLLRKAAADMQKQIKVDLYAIAPDVTINHHAATDLTKQIIYKTNSFAAFKELDYWMNYEKRKPGRLKQEIPTVRYNPTLNVQWNCAPYDDVTLLCATNAQGALLAGAYEVVMSAIAETLLLQMASETDRGSVVGVDRSDASVDSYSFQSAKSNEYAYKQNILRPYAENYCYRAVGSYSNTSEQKNKLYMEAEMVFSDVKAYCELPEHQPNMQSNDPTRFFDDFEALFNAFAQQFKTESRYNSEMFSGNAPWGSRDLRSMDETSAPHGSILDDWKRNTLNTKDSCKLSFAEQLLKKFKTVATEYIKVNGPQALKTMLSDPYNGFLKKLQEKIGMYETEAGNRRAAYTNAFAAASREFKELQDIRGLLTMGRIKDAFDAYKAQAESVYKNKQGEMFSDIMVELLTEFKEKVNNQVLLRNLEFAIHALNDIQESLSNEVKAMSEAASSTTLSSADEIKNQILAVYRVAANSQKLHDAVLNTVADACVTFDDASMSNEEEAAGVLIEKIDAIIDTVYHDINDVSLQKQLIDFSDVNAAGVSQYVQTKLAPELERGAQAHFALNPSYGGLNTMNAVLSSYISVPAGAEEVKAGIKAYIEGSGTYSGAVIKNSNIKDRIFWMNVVSGLPLCAYGLLSGYESVYESNCTVRPGTHLVRMNDEEISALNVPRSLENDWSLMPSPIPAKELGQKPLHDNIQHKLTRNEEILAAAEEKGLIVLNMDEGDYTTFSARVQLFKGDDGAVISIADTQKKLNEIEAARRIDETKLANVNDILKPENRLSFDPVDDVRACEQIIEFSKALGKSGVFNSDIDTQKKCFRELVYYKLTKRPLMIDELKKQIMICDMVKAKRDYYDELVKGSAKRSDAVKEVAQLWLYDLIKFNPMSVSYRDRQGNYKLGGDGNDNILFRNIDTICKEDYANYAPIEVRFVEWYAKQSRSREPFVTLASKLRNLYEQSQNPSDNEVLKCREYRETAKMYHKHLDDLITVLQADQDEMPKAYYDKTIEVLEGMQKALKSLELSWRGL